MTLLKIGKAVLWLAIVFLTGHPALVAQDFTLSAVSDLNRVFEDGYKFPVAFDTLKDSLGSRFYWINPKQRGKEIAGRVIKGFADHTDDPRELYDAKMQVITEILDFGTTPGLYVQTNPPEGSLITSGSTVEVFGWTEPGTKISVNGKDLPVSVEGLFLEQFGLTSRNGNITVTAENAGNLKIKVREFRIR